MVIKIVKKGTANSKPLGMCGSWVDEPPMNKK